MPEYEKVQVDTGWVRLESGSQVVLDQRIPTDIERVLGPLPEGHAAKDLPTVMARAHGELRPEFVPPFDTLKIDIHMSEPDYELGLDKERISSLEALQEDTFYSTENFVNMMGDLEAGRAHDRTWAGSFPSSTPRKMARMAMSTSNSTRSPPAIRKWNCDWTDAQGDRHERKRDFWVFSGAMQPRLIQRSRTRRRGGLESLTWLLPGGFQRGPARRMGEVEGQEQVEKGIFPAEQAQGQLA